MARENKQLFYFFNTDFSFTILNPCIHFLARIDKVLLEGTLPQNNISASVLIL